MFSRAREARGLAKPFGVGVPAAPKLREGARRSATGRIRRGELDAALVPGWSATETNRIIVTFDIELM
jgi:hypothetical protein